MTTIQQLLTQLHLDGISLGVGFVVGLLLPHGHRYGRRMYGYYRRRRYY